MRIRRDTSPIQWAGSHGKGVTSSLPPLSGCSSKAKFRNLCLSTSTSQFFETPRILYASIVACMFVSCAPHSLKSKETYARIQASNRAVAASTCFPPKRRAHAQKQGFVCFPDDVALVLFERRGAGVGRLSEGCQTTAAPTISDVCSTTGGLRC